MLFEIGKKPEPHKTELCGEKNVPMKALDPLPLDIRKVIARRAAMELRPNIIINLGIGIPSCVGSVANEENLGDLLTLSLETGPTGGVPVAGLGFGGAANPEMIATISDNFDFYDGGALDMAFQGLAEVDREGNVNVSKFNAAVLARAALSTLHRTRNMCASLAVLPQEKGRSPSAAERSMSVRAERA